MENLKHLADQIKWQFIILKRNNLINISVGVTAIYALIFYVFKDFPYMEKALTLLVYNDPSLIGLLFFGLAVILEANQRVLPAFLVTPMSVHHYLLARTLALSILGWLCALGMVIAAVGFSFHWLHFSAGVLAICFIFSLAGVFLISYTSEFLNYMLLSIPIMAVLSLPLLNYYGLTDLFWFKLVPTQGATDLLVSSYELPLSLSELGGAYGTTIVWIVILYWAAFKIFYRSVRN
ncbi:ABC transporter permease [Aureispira anguillae]|uniref:ABC transporter permease n=1 Tax=Aureispira anguillae TaxID=2864201 RepID=A0A915YDJ3_9BACT|nr:ABC transporter permease [Aureispira anguillae]BDS11123.1 ABC transporter permease [Aureispira anguillae]